MLPATLCTLMTTSAKRSPGEGAGAADAEAAGGGGAGRAGGGAEGAGGGGGGVCGSPQPRAKARVMNERLGVGRSDRIVEAATFTRPGGAPTRVEAHLTLASAEAR